LDFNRQTDFKRRIKQQVSKQAKGCTPHEIGCGLHTGDALQKFLAAIPVRKPSSDR
jgi:hypothetical protein